MGGAPCSVLTNRRPDGGQRSPDPPPLSLLPLTTVSCWNWKDACSSVAAVVFVVIVRQVAAVELAARPAQGVRARRQASRRQLHVAELADAHGLGRLAGQQVLLLRARAAHHQAALPAVVAAADGGELHLLAAHAHRRLRVWHPDGGVLARRRLAALLDQVIHALPDVVHPLRLLGGGGGVDGEGLGGRLDEPAVAQVAVVGHRVDGDALQGDDVLLVVLLLLNEDVAVDQDVIEQEELARFGLLAAHFGEDSLTDQHAAGDGQRLPRGAEAALHNGDPL